MRGSSRSRLGSVAVLGKQVLPAAGVEEAVAVFRCACRTASHWSFPWAICPRTRVERPPRRRTPDRSRPRRRARAGHRSSSIDATARWGHASVARAQDILARRYRLECADAAFELLKTSSQQSNVKLHTLADAVVRTPAPDLDARSWRRRPPPAGRSQCGTWAPRPYSTRHPVRPSCRRAAGPPTASPLITVKGHVLGMVSSHHGHPLHGFSRLQLAALQQTGTDVGRWLSWHWDTVVLDALERLHVQAVGACR